MGAPRKAEVEAERGSAGLAAQRQGLNVQSEVYWNEAPSPDTNVGVFKCWQRGLDGYLSRLAWLSIGSVVEKVYQKLDRNWFILRG